MIPGPDEFELMVVEESRMIGRRTTWVSLAMPSLLLALTLSGCGSQQPMQRLGGTLPPTQTLLPGLTAPSSPPGKPGAAQSETDDAASPSL